MTKEDRNKIDGFLVENKCVRYQKFIGDLVFKYADQETQSLREQLKEMEEVLNLKKNGLRFSNPKLQSRFEKIPCETKLQLYKEDILALDVQLKSQSTLIESLAGALEDLKEDKFSNREATPRQEKINQALLQYDNFKKK